MKKALRVFLIIILTFLIAVVGAVLYLSISLSSVKLDENKLINLEKTVTFLDADEKVFLEEVNGVCVTDITSIPSHTKNAFIAIEDKRFYNHNGIDFKGVFRAFINNIKSFSFKEGASTISQQLIKNTHLSNEKTLKRKIEEMKLSRELEKNYSKDQIIEKYLNTIYFGDNCYGISSAARHYFNKTTEELDINESAALAGIIKAPSNYSPFINIEKCNDRKNIILKEMLTQGYITQAEFNEYSNKKIEVFNDNFCNDEYDFSYMAKKELNNILSKSPYKYSKIKVYTSLNSEIQNIITQNLQDYDCNTDKSCVIMQKNGNICGYYSTCGDIPRQVGSTIKPLLVYAPSIENGIVSSATPILDEKTNFNGYEPSNYNEKYYGFVSVKDSLAKSLNVCSVKLLNYTGVKKSKSYLKNTDIELTENDNSLCLALGATEKGCKLTNLTAAYSIFNNHGYYSKPTFIDKILDENDNLLYKKETPKNKIFSDETISILNDMLLNVVKDGTAKKLSYNTFDLYAKTGTVGDEFGNKDAYTISYNSDIIVGTWFGKDTNEYMDNSISGGTAPCIVSNEIWKEIYKDNNAPTKIETLGNISTLYLDKLSYDTDHKLVLAEEIAPEKTKFSAIFNDKFKPNEMSKRFSAPEIKDCNLSVNYNTIDIKLCLTEYIDAQVYRIYNGKKELILDSYKNCDQLIDDIKSEYIYQYVIVPYYTHNNKRYYGKEIYTEKIKPPKVNLGDEWLNDELN